MAAHTTRITRSTLATWLFAGALGATIAAVLTCTLMIDRFARDEARQQALRYLQINADALRDALDRGMAQHYEEVHIIARLDQVARSGDPQAVRRILEQVRQSFPQFAWLGLTDRGGRVVAAVDGLLEGVDVSAPPWFAGAQQASFVGDVHRAVLLEKLLPAKTEPWRFVDVAVPVWGPQGELRGVLGAHLSWGWAAQIKLELVDRVVEPIQAQALVLGADGTVLLGPASLQGRKLADPDDGLSAQSRTQGSGRYPGLGWNVVLRQPEAVALAGFHALEWRMAAAALGLCALLAPLLWLLARRLAAPLWALAARLEDPTLTTAHTSTHKPSHPLYREAEVLGQALARYAERQAEDAARLRELNSHLEARVLERTAALTQAERRSAAGEQRLRTITDNLPVLISYIGRDERLQFVNATFERWTGQPVTQAIGQPLEQVIGPQRYGHCRAHLQQALSGQRVEFELQSQTRGTETCLQTIFIPDAESDTAVAGVYALSMDVSAMKAVERQLAQQARTDSLTGLPNRHSFNEKLVEALARCRRSGQPIALLFLDIDKFKAINDSLGHAAGDEVLKIFATRLAASVRQTDTVARLAGDEFVIILEGLHTPDEPQFVARKIIAAVNRPFDLPGRSLDISTSIGVAFQADGRIQAAALLAAADQALYEAKAGGRNTFRMASA